MTVWVPGELRLSQLLLYKALGIVLTHLQEVFDPSGLLPQVFETEIKLLDIEEKIPAPPGALRNEEILHAMLETLRERYTAEVEGTEESNVSLSIRWEPADRRYYLDPDWWKRDLALIAQQGPWGAVIILPEGVDPIEAERYLGRLASTMRFRFRKADPVIPFITYVTVPSLAG